MNRRDERKSRRAYTSPARRAAAERTRLAVVGAAKDAFENLGWSGTTLRAVAGEAGVSVKTVEAQFGTKASLLQTVVDFAIRGDLDATPIVRRPAIAEIEAAADAPAMLALHAAHIRRVNERSARVAWAVEQAAAHDRAAGALWARMNENRRFGIAWAARTLLSKPGRAPGLAERDVEAAFWVAFDWGTYRTLTVHAGLDADAFEAWLAGYYGRMFLPR